jgi:hypothetical protein
VSLEKPTGVIAFAEKTIKIKKDNNMTEGFIS